MADDLDDPLPFLPPDGAEYADMAAVVEQVIDCVRDGCKQRNMGPIRAAQVLAAALAQVLILLDQMDAKLQKKDGVHDEVVAKVFTSCLNTIVNTLGMSGITVQIDRTQTTETSHARH